MGAHLRRVSFHRPAVHRRRQEVILLHVQHRVRFHGLQGPFQAFAPRGPPAPRNDPPCATPQGNDVFLRTGVGLVLRIQVHAGGTIGPIEGPEPEKRLPAVFKGITGIDENGIGFHGIIWKTEFSSRRFSGKKQGCRAPCRPEKKTRGKGGRRPGASRCGTIPEREKATHQSGTGGCPRQT